LFTDAVDKPVDMAGINGRNWRSSAASPPLPRL
jgi:hypothetical protein